MIEIAKSTVKYPRNAKYEGEDNDEQILYIYRRAFITNIPWIFITLVFIFIPTILNIVMANLDSRLLSVIPSELTLVTTLFWYLFVFEFIFMNFTNWFFNIYMITSKKIIDMDFKGLTYKNISEAPITNVEDVTSNIDGTLGMIFNIGSVRMQTAAERTEFEFNDVYNPSEVRDIISDMVTEARKRHAK